MKRGIILIADSDPGIAQEIGIRVMAIRLQSLWVPNGREVVKNFINHRPDAVLLRDNLPDFDVWETARLIRAISDTPIIFISNQPDRLWRNRALQLGDDYMTPPWQWQRLPGRLAALLKRSPNGNPVFPNLYDDGYLKVDISENLVTRQGQPVPLSGTEFKLLSCFVRHPNRALTFGDILLSVWGHRYPKAKSDVNQYVLYLRHKIERNPAVPAYFQSIRGIGYLFVSRS
jgi:DNA-binding response OmpR family regulator